ncbi:MAG: SAM-dependent methyltransferase [Treponema sp.]|nr:SAM-dependent methyltransferase [Treponema sp.]
MLISVTLSKPNSNVEEELGKAYEKIKIKMENSAQGRSYFAEMFTKTQVFHQHFTESQLQDFLEKHAGKTFKNCVQRTDSSEITIMANKKGKITRLERPLSQNQKVTASSAGLKILPAAKKKNYLLPEGNPVPFLVLLGLMTADGKVIKSKYDKFRQINRFLEFVDDILQPVLELKKKAGEGPDAPIRIADFGCGKSYLTFAVHYLLTQIKNIPCQIEGLDLKEDVIKYCNDITEKLGLKNLIFHTGNISDYSGKDNPDIVITLHACDTATDFALQYAVERGAKAILSVPCCQHQVNQELGKEKISDLPQAFEPLLKWGIIKEKFSSLVTDALRGQWLESQGYKVQMLEFIDMEHTPKNILIRAVKSDGDKGKSQERPELLKALNINPEIWK